MSSPVRAILYALIAFGLSFAAVSAASPATSQPVLAMQTTDNDGDGIPDDLDPDDDNDGIADANDPAPNKPNAVVTQTPVDTNAPDQDSDGDTIPNDLDPDDNNNGTVDNDDPTPPGPVPTNVATAAPPTQPAQPQQPVSPPVSAPVVNALPSTGGADSHHATTAQSALIILSMATMICLTIRLGVRGRT